MIQKEKPLTSPNSQEFRDVKNNLVSKKEWETPSVIDLNIANTYGGLDPNTTEDSSGNLS